MNEIATKLKAMGMSDEVIALAIGLPEETIKNI